LPAEFAGKHRSAHPEPPPPAESASDLNESETPMPDATPVNAPIDRKQLIDLLNEDLQREFQAVIAYVNYSQVLKGAEYMNIADELEVHAKEELGHALKLSYWIDLRFDLQNEIETIRNYRRRVKQVDAMDEFALGEDLREILREEQDHLNALATALGEDTPDPGIADA
jgi:bacterioferritin